VALGIIADNTVLFTFGKEPRGFVLPWASEGLTLLGIHVSKMQLAIPVFGLGLAAVLHWFARRTKYGKAMLAVVQNADAARLMGINVPLAIVAAYALSTAFAGAAGIMIAPLFNVHSDMGTLFGLKAFAVAILGGLGSARGVVLAGFLFGVVEALITSMLGSAYTNILAFLLVIVALAIRPHGLLGRAGVKKV
jgi:branched-chain amino acid transport system permease protein